MNKFDKVFCLICAAFMVVILVACGGDKNPDPTPAADIYTAGTYIGEGTGFEGSTIQVEITVDGNSITAVKIHGDQETPAIGGAALPDLEAQIMEAQSADIDGVSTASYTSAGVKEALAKAISYAKGEATQPAISVSQPTPEPTPEPTPTPAPEVDEPSEEPTTEPSEEPSEEPSTEPTTEPTKAPETTVTPTATPAAQNTPAPEKTPEPTPEPTPAPAAGIYNPGTYTGSDFGFGGDVTVTVTVDDNNIINVVVEGPNETPGYGADVLDILADQIKANGANIDGDSRASFTSAAAKAAAKQALDKAKR